MDGRERLAKAFEGHVKRMGWSQQHVAAIGGPSTTTQTKITRGDGPLSRQTCQKIDVAMGWPWGTAGRVAAGEIDPPEGNAKATASLALPPEQDEELLTTTADQDAQGRLRYRGVMQSKSNGHKVELTYTPSPGWGVKVVELIDMMSQATRALDARAVPAATGAVSLPRTAVPEQQQQAAPAVLGAQPATDSPDGLPDWLTLAANTDPSPTDRERFDTEMGDWDPA